METKKWVKIAGRGVIGETNWGATLKRDKKIVNKEIKKLKKYINKKVMITGGGSSSYCQIGKIKEVWLHNKNEDYCPQVKIIWKEKNSRWEEEHGKQKFIKKVRTEEFTPYIDSYQISVNK